MLPATPDGRLRSRILPDAREIHCFIGWVCRYTSDRLTILANIAERQRHHLQRAEAAKRGRNNCSPRPSAACVRWTIAARASRCYGPYSPSVRSTRVSQLKSPRVTSSPSPIQSSTGSQDDPSANGRTWPLVVADGMGGMKPRGRLAPDGPGYESFIDAQERRHHQTWPSRTTPPVAGATRLVSRFRLANKRLPRPRRNPDHKACPRPLSPPFSTEWLGAQLEIVRVSRRDGQLRMTRIIPWARAGSRGLPLGRDSQRIRANVVLVLFPAATIPKWTYWSCP